MMPIFNKRKNATPEEPKAGCGSLAMEQVEEINNKLYGDDEEITNHKALFSQGFIAGLMFMATPKDAETYRMTPREYLENAYSYVYQDFIEDMMNNAQSEAARNVIRSLGIEGNVRVMTAEEFENGDDA
jgi:hypothetical protein